MSIWTKNRVALTRPVPGLVVVHDGALWVVAEKAGDIGWFVAQRVGGELVARYRFGLRRAALECRNELARGEQQA